MRTLFFTDFRNYDSSLPVFRRPSVRAIIFRDGKIAITHSLRYNYYKLPGGGIEKGETFEDALVRETMEETGLIIKRDTIKEFGMVIRTQKDDNGSENRIFCQENYYYTCEVEDEVCERCLEEDEKNEKLEFEWIKPVKAIEINRKRNHGPKDRFMIQRESRVLEILEYGLKQVDECLWRLPSSFDPVLSSDVFLIYGIMGCYVFDVGASSRACDLLKGINSKTAVISHFHQDHSTNLKNVDFDCIIDGKLDDHIVINDGVHLEIFNVVSTHCKNSIVMNVNEKYLLVGDLMCSTLYNGREAYNVQKLHSTIEMIEATKTEYVIPSHSGEILTKREALERLENIYSRRLKTQSFIYL